MVVHPTFTAIEVCSGAGLLGEGIRLALPAARTVCHIENEVTAGALLVARMEDGSMAPAPVWTDLRTFDGQPWRGLVDAVIGGYPCQPFSSAAGRARVADDPRYLWPDVIRVVRQVSPRLCFFENVGEHLRLGYFDVVRPDLEGAGYRVAEIVISADQVGASHGRERLFIMAMADADDGPGGTEQGEQQHAARDVTCGPGGRADHTALADCDGTGCVRPEIHLRPRGSRTAVANAGRPSPFPPPYGDVDAWRGIIAQHPELAPAVPDVRRVADGLARGMELSRRERLHVLGNGVVPPQVAAAFTLLAGELGFEW